MRNDWMRDNWIEENCPKESADQFSRAFVKHLMKQAYEEGRKSESRSAEIRRREDTHGPDFI